MFFLTTWYVSFLVIEVVPVMKNIGSSPVRATWVRAVVRFMYLASRLVICTGEKSRSWRWCTVWTPSLICLACHGTILTILLPLLDEHFFNTPKNLDESMYNCIHCGTWLLQGRSNSLYVPMTSFPICLHWTRSRAYGAGVCAYVSPIIHHLGARFIGFVRHYFLWRVLNQNLFSIAYSSSLK